MEYASQSQKLKDPQTQGANMEKTTDIEQLTINTIRFLAVDAVQKANSGHPGLPMGTAPMAYLLWKKYLKHNPKNPGWFNRDRFLLSPGHGSMLLYGLLHLTGYDLSMEDIIDFRQWNSKTPGHPEFGRTPGVEMTTGPLGQGFATGVGMAIAERFLAAQFNRPGHDIVDHYIYAIVSDGDLQEGISYEAASLAGHYRLGKLIYLFDDNRIQIEGSTSRVFSEDIRKRFEGFNWQVIGPIDGNDLDEIQKAVEQARSNSDQPALIDCRTNIAFGSPNKQDTAAAHGAPLGEEEVAATKRNLGWPEDKHFYIPEEVLPHMRSAVENGVNAEEQWNRLMESYQSRYPADYARFMDQVAGHLPDNWSDGLSELFKDTGQKLATRGASGEILNKLAEKFVNIMGGSADLGPSNKTIIKADGDFSSDNYSARNLNFGVREHAMAAICNGIALHSGIIPYAGTFLVFSDYMKPAMRLSALMGLRVIYIFSHDSIGLGEDGPTHQPIEHLLSMRAIPNLYVIRPADANETVYAWKTALQRMTGPTAIVTTRQKLPVLTQNPDAVKGAYIVREYEKELEAIIIATGSELSLALEASEILKKDGVDVRVVSMPSWELFEAQPLEYKNKIFPPENRHRLAVEAGCSEGWRKYVGFEGDVIGIDHFGASAPYEVLYEKFGITSLEVAKRVKKMVGK